MSRPTNLNPTGTRTVGELSDSDRHDLLSSGRRRIVLDVVGAHGGVLSVDELAAQVAARENGGSTANEQALERVRTALHHSHLPKMDALSVVAFDSDAGLVSGGENADGV